MRSDKSKGLGLALTAVLLAAPALAGIDAIFRDGFESGDDSAWQQPTRYVVFEGFYNHG